MNKGSSTTNQTTDKNLLNEKYSYVARDRIWKDHVGKINLAARNWPENWGFLSGKIENLVLPSIAPKKSINEPEKIQNYRPVPRTSSGWIGWKSTDETCRLEKYGPYTKTRGSILKRLNWPSEAIS